MKFIRFSIFLISLAAVFSCIKVKELATLTTAEPTMITATSSDLGGNISSSGGADITDRGVTWSTSRVPIIGGYHQTEGTGTGSFTSRLTGLTPNTLYYVRAYAINSAGTAYGNEVTFITFAATDGDGNNYTSVTIGTQTWLVENLRTTKFNDGTNINNVVDSSEWIVQNSPAFCWYNNDLLANKDTYGALYNWYTVNTGLLCPIGWHVPSNSEWNTLTAFAGDYSTAGDKLKEQGPLHWNCVDNNATNDVDFTALPGGDRWGGEYLSLGNNGFWWTTTLVNGEPGWATYFSLQCDRSYRTGGTGSKHYGFSVRCLKD